MVMTDVLKADVFAVRGVRLYVTMSCVLYFLHVNCPKQILKASDILMVIGSECCTLMCKRKSAWLECVEVKR
jgi:hypothetical protein